MPIERTFIGPDDEHRTIEMSISNVAPQRYRSSSMNWLVQSQNLSAGMSLSEIFDVIQRSKKVDVPCKREPILTPEEVAMLPMGEPNTTRTNYFTYGFEMLKFNERGQMISARLYNNSCNDITEDMEANMQWKWRNISGKLTPFYDEGGPKVTRMKVKSKFKVVQYDRDTWYNHTPEILNAMEKAGATRVNLGSFNEVTFECWSDEQEAVEKACIKIITDMSARRRQQDEPKYGVDVNPFMLQVEAMAVLNSGQVRNYTGAMSSRFTQEVWGSATVAAARMMHYFNENNIKGKYVESPYINLGSMIMPQVQYILRVVEELFYVKSIVGVDIQGDKKTYWLKFLGRTEFIEMGFTAYLRLHYIFKTLWLNNLSRRRYSDDTRGSNYSSWGYNLRDAVSRWEGGMCQHHSKRHFHVEDTGMVQAIKNFQRRKPKKCAMEMVTLGTYTSGYVQNDMVRFPKELGVTRAA